MEFKDCSAISIKIKEVYFFCFSETRSFRMFQLSHISRSSINCVVPDSKNPRVRT